MAEQGPLSQDGATYYFWLYRFYSQNINLEESWEKKGYTQQCLIWLCEVWRWCFLCRAAAQTGVLPRGADGPGDLHGEADPLSGQWHADAGVWELQQVHICYRWASISLGCTFGGNCAYLDLFTRLSMFFFSRHYKKDEERLQKDGGRDGLPVRQHGSNHWVQRQHQWNASRPARTDYETLRWDLNR